MVFHCCFNSHFPDEKSCGTSSHIISYLYICLVKVSVKVSGPFFKLFFKLLSFQSSLYTLDNIVYVFCNYFLPVCDLSAHSLDIIIPKIKVFKFFKNYLFIFIQLQLSAFSPLPSTPPQPVPPPSLTYTFPLDFVLVS